jgi:hypothetical protein
MQKFEFTTTIYALVDPRDGFPRYIGKTSSVLKRYSQHLKNTARVNNHLMAWLHELSILRIFPVLRILFVCNYYRGPQREKEWIAYGINHGWPLLNIATGGSDRGRWRHHQLLTMHVPTAREVDAVLRKERKLDREHWNIMNTPLRWKKNRCWQTPLCEEQVAL